MATHKSENAPKLENECIIEGEFDNQLAIGFAIASIKEVARIYGPIYTRMVSEHALRFEAGKLNEEPPENIQGLEAVTNYIQANLNRYPTGECSLVYGMLKTERMLQGHAGSSGFKRAAHGAIKAIFENTGMLKNVIGTTGEAYDALKMLPVVETKQVTRYHYTRAKEENGVIAVYSNCPYKDTCLALTDERITRNFKGLLCILLNCALATVEIVTKKHFDYALDEFNKPDCKGRIFEF